MTLAPLKVVFAGTPEFALPCLEALLHAPYPIAAVYTQPDRPAGRGRRPMVSPVKRLALTKGLQVLEPASLKSEEATCALAQLQADLMVVVAYGQLLPRAILDTPRLGCINVHASLLPRWRGAAPIQRAILAGDTETGISIMQLTEGLDCGPVLGQARCSIEAQDTAGTLHERLARLGAALLIDTLGSIVDGSAVATEQDDALASHAPKIERSEALLDWSTAADTLERRVRAFNPKPVAYARLRGQELRVWEAQAIARSTSAAPGTIVAAEKAGLDVATGAGLLRLIKLQLPGRRPVSAAEFLNARRDFSPIS